MIISNHEEFNKKLDGLKNSPFHIITDFDKTLTKAFTNGKKVQSSYSLLREGKYLNDNFATRSQKYFDIYHHFENSTEPLEFRQQKMNEWWHANWSLMKECGLSKEDLQDVVDKNLFESRGGLSDFFALIESIPVLIFSAGLGDLIELFLEKHDMLTPNVHIVSNFWKFDDNGNVIGIPSHFIHTLNKNEIEVKNKPYYQEVKNRKNVILLGDRIDDLDMVAGFDYNIILKIGFFNSDSKTLEEYKKHFDLIITHDGTMEEINELLRSIL